MQVFTAVGRSIRAPVGAWGFGEGLGLVRIWGIVFGVFVLDLQFWSEGLEFGFWG